MIYIEIPNLPPSSNQAYFNHPSGGRSLTKAGKAYKAEVTNHIIKYHGTQTKQLKFNATIGSFVALGFPDLLTKHWPKRGKLRYNKFDLDNRAKLLQDAFTEATSIDDSQICFDHKYKYKSVTGETRIWLWNEDEENVGARLIDAFATIIGCPRTV